MKMRSTIVILFALAVAGAWLFWPHQPAPVFPAAAKVTATPSASPQVAGVAHSAPAPVASSLSAASTNRFTFRLANTPKTIGQLTSDRHAILLANAFIETDVKTDLSIPRHLRATGEPGAFIVQARGATDAAFRAALTGAGGQVVSYIPNNAYLVQLTAAGAMALAGNPLVQAVLPYEPYYKISSSIPMDMTKSPTAAAAAGDDSQTPSPTLLNLAVNQKPLPTGTYLTLGLYNSGAAATEAQIEALGAKILMRDRSPFGPIVRVQPPDNWIALAQLPGVQIMEPAHLRAKANDLSRSTVGMSPTSVSPESSDYLNLNGNNVLVAVADTGIDATHPDLAGRVLVDTNFIFGSTGTDTVGHGTHVAGIIAGDGTESTTVKFAEGSTNPPVADQYRGKARLAKLYSLDFFAPDQYLQEAAARTNALISNNSWNYTGSTEYDLAAASYDAAVRDAVPEITGPQPVQFVFPAGNDGNGNSYGFNGDSDSILSPGTAKNVITVGALEQFRYITNWVTFLNGTSNQMWLPETDSSAQVAWFSGRGNVGVGTEGTYGRFKPDVVAPGTFVVSTRSQQWDTNAYYNDTFYHSPTMPPGQIVDTNFFNTYSINIPANTIGINIQVVQNALSPKPFPNLEIAGTANNFAGLDPANPLTYDFATYNNTANIPGDSALAPFVASGHLYFAVADTTNIPVNYTVEVTITTTNDNGNYNQVLEGMNDQLGDFYRYETGTSMAAADVTGLLALMQDYFTNTLHQTPSPALLKAILINGARIAWPGQYSYAVNSGVNLEGWGLVNLSNSLPAALANSTATTPLFFADQNQTNVLATGDSQTYTVNVLSASQNLPLRLTLAWTDPPGNPAAALKLVNSLELIVTNLTTGQIYVGNNFSGSGQGYSLGYTTNNVPALDTVNNVQSIVIPPTLGATYSVTVIGRSVNVNAVTAEQTNTVQDYALVIACDDAGNTGGVSVTTAAPVPSSSPQITFPTGTSAYNGINFNQIAGANAPLLSTNTIPFGTNSGYATNAVLYIGVTNQWHFYVLTNFTSYTNAAFVTFIPNTLALPREGVYTYSTANATRPEADLDLYVATEPGLTNLDPVVLANCISGQNGDRASLDRGGTAFVTFNNSSANQVYYIGVKCEDQMAGTYGFLGAFSPTPFSSMDTNGNEYVNAINVPQAVPDGNNAHPGVAYILGLAEFPIEMRNVIVTNSFVSQNFGDLLGILSHDEAFTTLNNHNKFVDATLPLVYEDVSTNAVALTNSIPSDGPGSLQNFVGAEGAGLWDFLVLDDAYTQTSSVTSFMMKLEPHLATNGLLVTVTVAANGWFYDYVTVPVGTTNLLVVATNLDGYTGLKLALQYNTPPTLTDNLKIVNLDQGSPPGNSISYGPPLTPGRYWIGIYNPDTVSHVVQYGAFLSFSASAITTVDYFSTDTPLPLMDDAVTVSAYAMTNFGLTNSTVLVTDEDLIQGINVGLRVDHPRISDLVFHLISPYGERYLLMENRGSDSTNGCGLTVISTNAFIPVSSSGSYQPDTNVINVGVTAGSYPITYNFYTVPDQMTVYYGTNITAANLIWDSTMVGNQAAPITQWVNFPPPGVPTNSTYLTIIMNQFGNPASTNGFGYGDAWDYTAGGNFTNYEYLAFTENTSLTTTPIKFAPVPFLPPTNNIGALTNLYYQAEQSLAPLVGLPAAGLWQLEVLDNRAGATNAATTLVSWRLEFTFANTNLTTTTYPILSGFQSQTNTIATNSIQWYQVNVPNNATFATNILDYASAPVNFWLSTNYPATPDLLLLANSTGGIGSVLSTNTSPLLVPGGTYYLGVQNTNSFSVTNVVEVDFDHGNLPPGPSSVQFNLARVSNGMTQLSWPVTAGLHYKIQWKNSLTGSWNTIDNPITSTRNGVATFTDNGVQTAPFGTQRFYRLAWVPEKNTIIVPPIALPPKAQ